jgi:hypothetical protein
MRSLGLLLLFGVGIARADEPKSADLREWIKARGATDASLADWQSGSCPEVVVGPAHETALQCYEQESATRKVPGADEPAYRVLDHYSLRVVRDQKLVILIDVPVKAEVLDAVPHPLNQKPPPWHPFVIGNDGMSIVVGDPSEAADCKSSGSRATSGTTEADRVWAALDHDLHDRICKARGRYVWTKGLFRRNDLQP